MIISTLAVNKFFHLIASSTLVGINIAMFFYIIQSQRQKHEKLMLYALRVSYFSDVLYIVLIITIFITATMLQHALHLNLNVAWIKVAHIAFGLTIILWMTQMMIRIMSYKQKKLIYPKSYISISIITWIIFAILIRDASTHSTWITLLGTQ